MQALAFIGEVLGPVVAVVGGAMVAGALNLPQGVGFEYTLVFEVATVALAAVVLPTVVGYAFYTALREELARN